LGEEKGVEFTRETDRANNYERSSGFFIDRSLVCGFDFDWFSGLPGKSQPSQSATLVDGAICLGGCPQRGGYASPKDFTHSVVSYPMIPLNSSGFSQTS